MGEKAAGRQGSNQTFIVYHAAAPEREKRVSRRKKAWRTVLCAALALGLCWLLPGRWDNRYRLPRPALQAQGYTVPRELLEREGYVFLCEGWAFYPGQLLRPADFARAGRVEREGLRPQPLLQNGKRQAAQSGTYRLQLTLSAEPQTYMLELPGALPSEVWINGRRAQASFGGTEGRAVLFEAAGALQITILAAGEKFAAAEDVSPPALGLPQAVHAHLRARLLARVFICSLAGLLGVVVLLISARVGTPELGGTFFLFCIGCIAGVGSAPLLALWPGSGFLLLGRKLAPYLLFFSLEWISGILCGLCDLLPRPVMYSGLLPFALAAVQALGAPPPLFWACELALELYAPAACAYLVGAAVFAVKKGRPYTMPLAVSFGCMGLGLAAQRLAGRYSPAKLPELFFTYNFLLLLVFTAVLCAHGIHTFHKGIEAKEREKAVRRLLSDQKAYCAELAQRQRAAHEFQHEVRHQLFLLQYYLQNGEQGNTRRIFEGLLDQTLPPRPFSGNPLLNALLTDFSAACKGKQIAFFLQVSGVPATLPCEDEDLCCVLMNLFQNAAEACEKLPPQRKREIRLTIRGSAAALRIQCVNAKANPVRRRGERLLSGKANPQEHGYGLMLVQRTMEKYGGDLELEYTEESFCVWAVLPLGPVREQPEGILQKAEAAGQGQAKNF